MKFFDKLFHRNKETKTTPLAAPVESANVVPSGKTTRSSTTARARKARKRRQQISKNGRRKNRGR